MMSIQCLVRRARFTGICASVAVFAFFTAGHLSAGSHSSASDHAHHQHHGHAQVPEMDEDGKRLSSYQVRHEMSPDMLAEFRRKISLYRGMTDMEINMNMSAMGPNYEWYASDLERRGDIGILILTHGVGENSDRMLRDSFMPVANRWPTAIGFGMAMMQSAYLQSAIDDLEARGAETIVVVPSGPTSEHNSLTRQWRYIFEMGQDESSYLDVPRVESDATLLMTPHFEGHELITEILYDHAREVSKDAPNEVLIIVAHGPEEPEDNVPDLAVMQAHVDRIAERGEFADVKIINLQDDAIPAIRASNVRRLRRWVKQANQKNRVPVVVAFASASHGVQTHIRNDLRGMDYVFAEKGMSEHPNYVRWVMAAIEQTLTDAGISPAPNQES